MLSDYILQSNNSLAKKLIHLSVGRRALQKAIFHATSEAEYTECKNLIPLWQGFMIPNIINLPAITIEKSANKVFTLLFLSRIHPKKGVEFLLEALTKITVPVLLRIAGSGDPAYIDSLKQQAMKLGVSQQIEWIGWKDRTEKFKELARADLFVLPSYNENFANAVIESLHVGTPVLISDRVGLAPFVEKEKLGWIVPVESEAIARQIKVIIDEREQLEWITRSSYSVIKQHFSEKRLIAQYLQQYQQVVENKYLQNFNG
jgi:glycosyltransferase involved in cell wall biosynthesis